MLAGMRPGEIFAMTWGRLTATYADIMQRVYRAQTRHAENGQFNPAGCAVGWAVSRYRSVAQVAVSTRDDAWVFPSERMTPLSKDNCWRRSMLPKLEGVGLGWCNFQVMRRTHATLMRQLKADPKLVADQLGHTVDVSLNVYAQSPVAGRAVIVNELEMLIQ